MADQMSYTSMVLTRGGKHVTVLHINQHWTAQYNYNVQVTECWLVYNEETVHAGKTWSRVWTLINRLQWRVCRNRDVTPDLPDRIVILGNTFLCVCVFGCLRLSNQAAAWKANVFNGICYVMKTEYRQRNEPALFRSGNTSRSNDNVTNWARIDLTSRHVTSRHVTLFDARRAVIIFHAGCWR